MQRCRSAQSSEAHCMVVKGFGGGENIFLSCEGVRGACHLSVRGLTRQNLRPGRELRRCDTQLRYVELKTEEFSRTVAANH